MVTWQKKLNWEDGLKGIIVEEIGPVWLVTSGANFARLQEFARGWHKRRREELDC